MQVVNGFSKLTKEQKIDFLKENYLTNTKNVNDIIKSFWHPEEKSQKIFDEFSENTLTNFFSPYGVVPNMMINEKIYCVPMVIEESSVVAACSKAAKFWLKRGGFKTKVISTAKIGQVHLDWSGKPENLKKLFDLKKDYLIQLTEDITANMRKRGGGIKEIKLVDKTDIEKNYYQIYVTFETCDAMGANFINTVLECLGNSFKMMVESDLDILHENERDLTVIMSILSNYTPECLVRAEVSCPVSELSLDPQMKPEVFAKKFAKAVRIAEIDVNRATTHNKGIFNGIDAVVLATGNDFRAIEACGHTYAAKEGQYASLSHVEIKDDVFHFWLEIPLAVGTIGGLTNLHPMAKISLDLMNNPTAAELMQIIASVGLAQNFAALSSLVTTGIQKGHMKMHLMNILNHLEASEKERELAKEKFATEVISFNSVRDYITQIRTLH